MVAALGVEEKQPQQSPPPAWSDEDDGVGVENSRYRRRRGEVDQIQIGHSGVGPSSTV